MTRKHSNKQNIFSGLSEMTWKQWSILFVLFVILVGYGVGQYNKFIRSHRSVSEHLVKNSLHENKTIVFYRDDCSSCRNKLPLLLARNIFKQDLVLVNMNGTKNNHFKKDYQLKQVPTLINKSGKYQNLSAQKYLDAVKAVENDTLPKFSNSTDPTVN